MRDMRDKKDLQLMPVEFEEVQSDLFKSMSLDELLAALELVIEIEQMTENRFCPTSFQDKPKYLQ